MMYLTLLLKNLTTDWYQQNENAFANYYLSQSIACEQKNKDAYSHWISYKDIG